MTEDIAIDERQDTRWDEVGDIATRTGDEQLRQSIVISVLRGAELTAPSFAPEDIEETRGEILAAVRANERTREPIRVTVSTRAPEQQRIEYAVQTARTAVGFVAE